MKLFAFIITCLLMGCKIAQPKATIIIPNIIESDSLILIDERPQSEKESILFGKNPLTCSYAIERYGDDRMTPNKLRLLQHRTFEKFKYAVNKPNQIIVKSFVVYHSIQEYARSQGTRQIIGLEYNFGSKNKTDCEPPEILKAYYTKAENPKGWPIFIIYIEAEINNQNTSIRFPFAYLNTFTSNRKYQISAIEQAIKLFLSSY